MAVKFTYATIPCFYKLLCSTYSLLLRSFPALFSSFVANWVYPSLITTCSSRSSGEGVGFGKQSHCTLASLRGMSLTIRWKPKEDPESKGFLQPQISHLVVEPPFSCPPPLARCYLPRFLATFFSYLSFLLPHPSGTCLPPVPAYFSHSSPSLTRLPLSPAYFSCPSLTSNAVLGLGGGRLSRWANFGLFGKREHLVEELFIKVRYFIFWQGLVLSMVSF